ncbi:DNA primase, partial [Agromyces sp. CFH 90414]|nr:DNA primase [Agromyces agglutinans]
GRPGGGRPGGAGRRPGADGRDGGGDAGGAGRPGPVGTDAAPVRPYSIADLPGDPSTRLERDALQAILQFPDAAGLDLIRQATDSRFGNETLAVVRDGVASVVATDGALRVDRVVAEVPAPFAGVVQQLAVAPVPQRTEAATTAYVRGVVASLVERELLRQKRELLGRLQRTDPADRETYAMIQRALVDIELDRRSLTAAD